MRRCPSAPLERTSLEDLPIGFEKAPIVAVSMQDSPGVWVVTHVLLSAGAYDEETARLRRLIGHVVGARYARRPACSIAGVQDLCLAAFGDGHLARQHINEFVFVLVPVVVGRPRAGVKSLDASTVVGEASRIRQSHGIGDTEGLAFSTFGGNFILPDDHLWTATARGGAAIVTPRRSETRCRHGPEIPPICPRGRGARDVV